MKKRVTPSMAKKWLKEANGHNFRSIDKKTVERYKRDMASGHWDYNGESIKFDTNNLMVDGQHRCVAIVESGVSIETEIVQGIVSDYNIDRGQGRRFVSELRRLEVPSAAIHASATRISKGLDDGYQHANRPTYSTSELLSFWNEHKELIMWGVSEAQRAFKSRLSQIGAIFVYFWWYDPDACEQFVEEVVTGEGLLRTDPAYVLREYVYEQQMADRQHRHDSSYFQAIVLKCVTAAVEDKPLERIPKWVRTGKRKEPFPFLPIET